MFTRYLFWGRMNRRRFNKLAGLVGVGVWAGGVDLGTGQAESLDNIATASSGQTIPAGEVVLEDDSLVIAFDSGSGALVRSERKSTHWMIQRRRCSWRASSQPPEGCQDCP